MNLQMNFQENQQLNVKIPFYRKFGYKGYLGTCYTRLDKKDNKIKRVSPKENFDNGFMSLFFKCDCGHNFIKPIEKDYSNIQLKKIYCTNCGNQNFLIDPSNKTLSDINVIDDENTIKIYKIYHSVKLNKICTPFIESSSVIGYFISKKNGTIQRATINPPHTTFSYQKISNNNDFLLEYAMPILLKDSHKEFEILNLQGTNFSIFTGKNKVQSQEELCKFLFKNTYTKSVKRDFFKNLNNKDICVNENYLLTYKTLGKYFKDSNNVTKVLRANFFLEKFGTFQSEISEYAFGYKISTAKFVDYFFEMGISIYGENAFSTNISKMDYKNTKDSNMHLYDLINSISGYSKRKFKKMLKDKNVKYHRPIDVFKGLHDIGAIYYDFTNADVIPFAEFYSDEIIQKIGILNNITKLKEINYKLPQDTRELKYYGNYLNNCVYSYAINILKKDLYIIGIFLKNKLFACMELVEDKIVQLRTFNNALLEKQDLKLIRQDFEQIGIKAISQ